MKRLFAIALLLVACSREKSDVATGFSPSTASPSDAGLKPGATSPPTAEQAKLAIQSSMEFGEYQFTEAAYSLPVSAAMMNDPQRAAASDLAKEGWISRDGAGDVMLNDKSRTDRRFLLRQNGILDIVPLAKKEMGAVEAVRANPDGTVSADFTWRWIANEVATSFLREKYEGTHNATATLRHDGAEWRVEKISER